MPHIKINEANFYYELHGQGDPLVLIAGYTCDHTFWSAMLEELAGNFQVLIFDNRGVGQTTDRGAPITLEEMAADTLMLIQKLGLKTPSILGQSMGGAISQIIARQYPDEINKLVILNSAAKFNLRTNKAIESFLRLRKEDISTDLLIETSLPWFFSSNYLSNPENITAIKEIMKNNPFPQTIKDQERQFKAVCEFDSRDWLSDIKASSLIIAGEEDIVSLPSESLLLAKGIPGAQLLTIPGGHASPMEQPHVVNEAILQFLD